MPRCVCTSLPKVASNFVLPAGSAIAPSFTPGVSLATANFSAYR